MRFMRRPGVRLVAGRRHLSGNAVSWLVRLSLGALERGTSLWKAIIEGFVDLIEGLRPTRPP